MGKCCFKEGKIVCRREAVKVIAVKRGQRVLIRWECCEEHTATVTYEALDYSAQFGGGLHTTKIEGPKVRATDPDKPVHVYLMLRPSLISRMINARQKSRMAGNPFIIDAIERRVSEIEDGK